MLVVLGFAAPAYALQANQIALIVNSNVPAGRKLAQLYVRLRHLPPNRILELSLPTGDDISFDEFEKVVVPQVREFLRTGDLDNKVTCLVTCYGVPLRMDGRKNNAEESAEFSMLARQIQPAVHSLQKPIADLESLAKSLLPGFTPGHGMDFDSLVKRTNDAVRAINAALKQMPDHQRRAKWVAKMYAMSVPLVGTVALLQDQAISLALHPTTNPAATTELLGAQNRLNRENDQIAQLQQQRYDAHARGKLRDLVKANFGGFNYVRLMRDQLNYLDPRDTTASFDSELSMVRVLAYSHVRWLGNPYDYRWPHKSVAGVLMVSRLDGPSPAAVRSLIENSVKVEQEGLHGTVVVDSRGMRVGHGTPSQNAFAVWDQYFRNFAELVRTSTSLTLVADDKPALMAPRSADHVALYAGWYSLRHYVPVCTFNRGALGFHLASYECISIHNPTETGWVRGLLNAGVVGTFGPVAEPYLQSFPRPDDFFPLMLTGKFTLAEAYWRTTPMVSWMQVLVGDPLYNPYKQDPALAMADLPARLRNVTPP